MFARGLQSCARNREWRDPRLASIEFATNYEPKPNEVGTTLRRLHSSLSPQVAVAVSVQTALVVVVVVRVDGGQRVQLALDFISVIVIEGARGFDRKVALVSGVNEPGTCSQSQLAADLISQTAQAFVSGRPRSTGRQPAQEHGFERRLQPTIHDRVEPRELGHTTARRCLPRHAPVQLKPTTCDISSSDESIV